MKTELLRADHITKSYNRIRVLNHTSFHIFTGEILAIIGENGAGKSTLVKILIGETSADSGRIYYKGQLLTAVNSAKLASMGIGVVHQKPLLVPFLSIMENIYVIRRTGQGEIFIDRRKYIRQTRELLKNFQLDFSPLTKVSRLSFAQQRMIEILKAISIHPQLLILDEPAHPFSEQDFQLFQNILLKLKQMGTSVLLITHNIDEVMALADRVVVLRDGSTVFNKKAGQFLKSTLLQVLLAGPPSSTYTAPLRCEDQEVLRVEHLAAGKVLKDITFSLKKGEILGITGLSGSGKSTLLYALFGLERVKHGEIFIHDKKCSISSPRDAIRQGLGLIVENRFENGLIMHMTTAFNLMLCSLNRISRCGFVLPHLESYLVKYLTEKLGISPPSPYLTVDHLSGGNQQKVLLAKSLAAKPSILLMDQPTSAIDMTSKKELYLTLSQIAQEGTSILLVSNELHEVCGICNRVLVINNGCIDEKLSRQPH